MLKELSSIARKAGQKLITMQSANLNRIDKGSRDFATEADLASQEMILAELARAFPGVPILAEEQETHEVPKQDCFIIDPLDGTFVYCSGADTWGVIINYFQGGVPQAGIVFQPAKDRLLAVEAGSRPTINGSVCKLNPETNLAVAGISLDLGSWLAAEDFGARIVPVASKAQFTKSICSTAVNTVEILSGWTSGYLSIRGAKIWDLAISHLAVTQAGGVTSALDGKPLAWEAVPMNGIFAANPQILRQLQELVNAAHIN